MYPADEKTLTAAVLKWLRADPEQRVSRLTEDAQGRPVRELVSYGVVRVRVVDIGGGIGEVFTETGQHFVPPDEGHIAFKTWQSLETTYGTAPRVVPKRSRGLH